MDISEQVATFEQSKKLVELGVKLDTYFRFVEYLDGSVSILPRGLWSDLRKGDVINTTPTCTVAELGVLIPHNYLFCVFKEPTDWCCITRKKETFYATEAEARATLLIWLIENNRLQIEDLKL